MRSWTIAFSLGIALCGLAPQLPSRTLLLLLFSLALLLHCWPRLRQLAAFLLGCCWLSYQGAQGLEQRWPTALENRDVWVRGTIWNLPQQTERTLRFQFRIEQVCQTAELQDCDFSRHPIVKRKVLLNLYQPLPMVPGQQWQLQVRLRRPHGFANPGGFDYEAWLLAQGLGASGYVREHAENRLLAEAGLSRSFEALRQALARGIDSAADAELRYPHLIRALTIGDYYGINETEWELFRHSGTSHLIVISGLHVALVALVLYRMTWWLAAHCSWLLLRWPAPQCAALVALAGAWCYASLAGLSLPVQRAFVMAAVLLAGRLLKRQCSPSASLCLALAAILLIDPLAPQNPSFWLSYGAVAVLLTMASANTDQTELSLPRRCLGWLLRDFRTQLLVFVGLIPVLLVFFQQLSPLAPLVNMPAIPYTGLLIVPLCLVAALLLHLWPAAAELLLRLADWLLHGFMEALHRTVEISGVGVLQLPALPLLPTAAVILLSAAVLLAPHWRWQVLALLSLPLPFLWPAARVAPGKVELTMLDVGQGLALVVSTRNHHLVYDAGPWFSTRLDAGSDVVVPFMRHRNISDPDLIMISHADSDHAGGLEGLTRAYPDARFLGSDTSIFPPQLDAGTCTAGQRWYWDGIEFALLHPDAEHSIGSSSRNNGSCVLAIRVGNHRLLLPGDIERAVEHRLLAAGLAGQLDVLVAPHHGSNTSSTPAFVSALKPELVLYSSGYLNRFRHPTAAVQDRYTRAGSRQLQTVQSGAITVLVGPEGIESIREQRLVRRRFWSTMSEPAAEEPDAEPGKWRRWFFR